MFPESVKRSVCFFCDESANEGDVRMACTMDIDYGVRSVAHKLSEFRLISKLSTADMVATGAKYHARCLAAQYNHAREHDKESSSEWNSQSEAHSIVLAEETQEIHSTRLKEKLIEAIPGITAHNGGGEVLLAFTEDIGTIISDAFSNDNDANEMCLQRAACPPNLKTNVSLQPQLIISITTRRWQRR